MSVRSPDPDRPKHLPQAGDSQGHCGTVLQSWGALASKGLTILACRARTTAETERVRKQEHALSATENTRQLEDLLRLTKGTTRAPADNFWELKMNIATFMSLVWVLFGSECDYYKSLQQVYKTLKLKEVYVLLPKLE